MGVQVDNEVRGKLALVTGASGGIGSACARDLALQGTALALTYSKNKASVDALKEEILKLNPDLRISTHQVEMSSIEEVRALFPALIEAHNQTPDILVFNAGYGKRIRQIWDIPVEEFDLTLNVNVRASFLLVQGCVERMKEQRWGRIIFVSSIAAHGGGVNGAHYAASKGALTSLMKNLATRLGEYNISVNDVAPAMIGDTGMIPDEKNIPGVKETIPLGRLGTPDEVAHAVTMFARTGYCTGQTLLLSGGLR